MKKNVLILSVLVLAFITMAYPIKKVTASTVENGKITVCGIGEIYCKPDTAIFKIGVETKTENLSEGQTENSNKVEAIINALIDYGIEKDDIKTTNFNVYQRYDYSNGERFIGYHISNCLEFKSYNLSDLGNVVNLITKQGANYFQGIDFEVSNYSAQYLNALNLAMENAKSKAQTLIAGDGNLKINSIKEQECCYIPISSYKLSESINSSGSIINGNVGIKAIVSVEFDY